jgi:fatty acid desaturase
MTSTASTDQTATTAEQAPAGSAGPAPTKVAAVRPSAAAHLTDEQIEELGRELDAIRAAVIEDRGTKDAAYIRRVIRAQRSLEVAGRAALLFAKDKPAWIAGTGMLTVAKILENMEIGHNVLHGQWDWMRDPDIHSTTWEWDFVTPAEAWQHTHNDLHHTWTNVVGKDRDVGYTILRMDEDQPWEPKNLGNPLYNALLAPVFEWGIALYDLELDQVREGTKSKAELRRSLKNLGGKFAKQIAKDYVATPVAAAVLSGSGKQALAAAATANAVRTP